MSNQQELSMRTRELIYSPFGNLLVSPYEVDYGAEELPKELITYKNIEIRLGDRPLPRNLRRLYEEEHKELPPDVDVFDGYDIWLITHCIGAIDHKGTAEIVALGYEADFKEIDKVYTIELMPQTKFVSPFEGSFVNKADLFVEGNAQVPDTAKKLLDKLDYIGGDAKINLSSELKMIGKAIFSVMSPVIQSIGVGSSRCEWMFEVDKKPLLGDQVMLQTVLVPRYTSSVSFKIRGYALIKAHWISFPAKFYTKWLDIELPLISEDASKKDGGK